MQLPPDLVIFDCDGVLVDSETVTNHVIRESLGRFGLTLEIKDIHALFVGGTMQSVYVLAQEMGAALPDDWVDTIYGEMFAALEQKCDLIPGVTAALDALDAAKIPYAVGSNGPHAKMRITLEKTGLATRLDGRVISREDVAHPKPAPDVYLFAARRIGVPPARCVVIEDSVSGASAGKAAGMVCFGFAMHTPAERLAPICDAVFDDMTDLPKLLGL